VPLHPLVNKQGQLSDPLYFDFIVFSQADAASRLMRQGKQVGGGADLEGQGCMSNCAATCQQTLPCRACFASPRVSARNLPPSPPSLLGELQVFEEYDEESQGQRVVTRDPSLANNALLPGALHCAERMQRAWSAGCGLHNFIVPGRAQQPGLAATLPGHAPPSSPPLYQAQTVCLSGTASSSTVA
jgi:hypothetical protein